MRAKTPARPSIQIDHGWNELREHLIRIKMASSSSGSTSREASSSESSSKIRLNRPKDWADVASKLDSMGYQIKVVDEQIELTLPPGWSQRGYQHYDVSGTVQVTVMPGRNPIIMILDRSILTATHDDPLINRGDVLQMAGLDELRRRRDHRPTKS